MIITHVDLQDFTNAFRDYNRADNFSYAGLKALFFYLEEVSEDMGEDIVLDVIGICCDFTEYESVQEIAESYNIQGDTQEILSYLYDRTSVIDFKGGIIIQNY